MTPNATIYGQCSPEYLRGLIESSGLSQGEVASLIGVNVRTLRYYLHRNCPKIPYTVQFTVEAIQAAHM